MKTIEFSLSFIIYNIITTNNNGNDDNDIIAKYRTIYYHA